MEQALQLKRANNAPCKNDRKAYLQRVMLTRWEIGFGEVAPLIDSALTSSRATGLCPEENRETSRTAVKLLTDRLSVFVSHLLLLLLSFMKRASYGDQTRRDVWVCNEYYNSDASSTCESCQLRVLDKYVVITPFWLQKYISYQFDKESESEKMKYRNTLFVCFIAFN